MSDHPSRPDLSLIGDSHSERVQLALQRLIGQRDELQHELTKLVHEFRMHEVRTQADLDRINTSLNNINDRIVDLENECERCDDLRATEMERKFNSERARASLLRQNIAKGIGSVLLLVLGAIVSWTLKRVLGQ